MFEVVIYKPDKKIVKKSVSHIAEKDFNDTDKIWINIPDPTWKELMEAKGAFSLHFLTMEDCQSKRTRIKLEEFRKYTYIVLFGLTNIKEKTATKLNLNFIVGANFLVTTQFAKMESYTEFRDDDKKLSELFEKGKGMEFILHRLIDLEVDKFFPYVARIDDTVEKAETEISRGSEKEILDDLFKFKREVVQLQRKTNSERRVMENLSNKDIKFLDPDIKIYFRDVLDHVVRISEIMDGYRDLVSNTLDIHLTTTSLRTNDVMRVLTIIATIMMPLTVIAGIYGMNFEFMPELQTRFGYFIVLGIMAIVVIGLLSYFKRKDWL